MLDIEEFINKLILDYPGLVRLEDKVKLLSMISDYGSEEWDYGYTHGRESKDCDCS